jgi:hypothetical protein
MSQSRRAPGDRRARRRTPCSSRRAPRRHSIDRHFARERAGGHRRKNRVEPEVELAPNFKGYSSFGAGINVGASGTLDIALSLFNGHFSMGFTLMGMDASTKGVTVYVGGVGLGL